MAMEAKDNDKDNDKQWITTFLDQALKSEKQYPVSKEMIDEITDEWLDDSQVNSKKQLLGCSFSGLSVRIKDHFGLSASKEEKAAWVHIIWAAIKLNAS
eukprot:UN13757